MERSLSQSKVWRTDERSGLRLNNSANDIEKLISVRLNSTDPDANDGYFDLYYFVVTPTDGLATKTVLFCAGGPGDIVRGPNSGKTYADFLVHNEYNVAAFHIRGSGFSQIPPSNQFDRFLTTRYAVEDIEAIRKDFLGEDGVWDAIIARSYGTVLAQQYAHYHSDKVRKLILIAPLSRHMFNDSKEAFDAFAEDVYRIHRQSLESIYNSNREEFRKEFGELRPDQKRKIIEEIFGTSRNPRRKGIFQRAEDAFGSIQFLLDAYCELKKNGELKRYDLDRLSPKFFQKLRDLRLSGSLAGADQFEIGRVIRDEVLWNKRAEDNCLDEGNRHIQGQHRVFYAIGVHDGINPRFLRAWLANDNRDLRDALREIGGEARVNEWIEKIGITGDESIEPWDPGKYFHRVPTLILKGEADPVTAGGQAEYIYAKALRGPRTLIEFSGIGHEFALPGAGEENSRPILSGTARLEPPEIPPGETRSATGPITGRSLNENLRIDLHPPQDLEPGLELAGFGVVVADKINDASKQRDNFVALIKNTGNHESKSNVTECTISSAYFVGIIRLNIPAIAPGQTQPAFGTVIHGSRNKQREFRLRSESKIEPGLEPFGFKIHAADDTLSIWLKNKSKKELDPANRKWTIWNEFSSKTFSIDSEPIKPGELVSVSADLEGLTLDKAGELQIIMPEVLTDCSLNSCIPPQEETAERKVSISIWNEDDTKTFNRETSNGDASKWAFHTRAFSADLSVTLPEKIAPRSAEKAYGTITGIRWNDYLKVTRPMDLEPDLELLGFNIEGKDKLTLLLKNTGTRTIKSSGRDWIYCDPSDAGSGSACLNCGNLLSCLIYSFLVMDGQRFNSQDNKILEIIKRRLKKHFVAARIEFGNGSVTR